MKLLQIASGDFFSTYGGGQVYVKNIVDEMIRQGLDIAVLSFVDKDIDITEHNYKGIQLWEIGKQVTSTSIEELLRTISPNIIHAHSQKALFASLGEHLNIPVVITAHHGGILCPAGTLMNADDAICNTTLSHKNCLKCCLANIRTGRGWYPVAKLLPKKTYIGLGKRLQKLPFIPFITPIGSVALAIENKINEWQTICDKATKIIAPSNAIANAMCRNGLAHDKVNVIPHGIPKNTRHYHPECNEKQEIIRFFYVGRICRVKGIHVLLEAFSGLKNSNKAELHIIGAAGNKSERRYMQSLKQCYQSPNIIWHGKVPADKVFETIKDYDVMVHPAIYLEIFGLNIAEALAMDKPVLATRCGGAEMQIKEDVNGWLAAPNDIQVLRTKMEEIVEHGITIDTTALHENVISINEHVKELIQVYEKEAIID